MTPLEKIQSMKMPFAELKGVTFTEAGLDRVVAKMLVRPDLCTLHHTLHGGAIMDDSFIERYAEKCANDGTVIIA